VWEYPVPHQEIYNFTVQTYRGEPVLTWWQGHLSGGHGVGIYVIANQNYELIAMSSRATASRPTCTSF